MLGQQPSQIPPPINQPSVMAPYQAPPQQYQAPGGTGGFGDEIKSLWIGDLLYWMDVSYVARCFAQTGQVISVNLIWNKQTLQLEGYGFIEFTTRAAAEQALRLYNERIMPNTTQNFRLKWASFGAGERRGDGGSEHSIYVGDSAADVTDQILEETSKSHYQSVKRAEVVIDHLTGRPKDDGFVKFGDVNEQMPVMTEMQGMYCSSSPMRTALYQSTEGTQADSDPTNTKIYFRGLDTNVPEEELRRLFSTYGELVHVFLRPGKRSGFVRFANRSCAEEALLMLNGTQVGSQSIRLSWGLNTSNKQAQQQDPIQYGGDYCGSEYYGYGYDYGTNGGYSYGGGHGINEGDYYDCGYGIKDAYYFGWGYRTNGGAYPNYSKQAQQQDPILYGSHGYGPNGLVNERE